MPSMRTSSVIFNFHRRLCKNKLWFVGAMKNELPQKRLSGRLNLCRHRFASVWGDCFDALTHVAIRVSSAFIFQTFAEVCYSVSVQRSSFKSVLNLRKAYTFKSLLKVYFRSVFNESWKRSSFKSLLKVYTLSNILLWIKPSYVIFFFGKCVLLLVHASNQVV